MADEYDLDEVRDQATTLHVCKESLSSGVYIGERSSVSVCGIVTNQGLTSCEQGKANDDAENTESQL